MYSKSNHPSILHAFKVRNKTWHKFAFFPILVNLILFAYVEKMRCIVDAFKTLTNLKLGKMKR